MEWIFFGPAKLIAWQPLGGFCVGAMLISCQLAKTLVVGGQFGRDWFRNAPVLAGLLWCIFNLYEAQTIAVFASGTTAVPLFRFDLVVLTPLLYVLTAFACYTLVKPTRPS